MWRCQLLRVLFALLILLASVAFPSFVPAATSKLNFVVIVVDDLGWADLACYGSTYHRTPHIDRLASEGIRFTYSYAAAAICSPTRAAYMTGRYPVRTGITDWIRARFQGGKIPPDRKKVLGWEGGPKQTLLTPVNPLWMDLEEITIPELLKTAGYSTCHIGKWHLGTDDWSPEKQGYDVNIGGCDLGEPPAYFDPYCRAANLVEPGEEPLCGIPTLSPRLKGEYLTDREADEAVHFIKTHKDQPFFLSLCHYAVHAPIQAKKTLIDKYWAIALTGTHNVPAYAAMLESVDDSVGRILQTLDEQGLSSRTVVLFTSDNGGLDMPKVATNNAPLRAGKGTPYEGGIRIPTILRWPKVVQPSSLSDEPIITMDYFPTILEMAGVPPPTDRVIDGVSLVPHLCSSGKEAIGRTALYWHFPHYREMQGPYSIVRTGTWKLIRWYESGTLELYDVVQDVSEKTNLAATMPSKSRELNVALEEWLYRTGAKIPRPNPEFSRGK